MLLASRNSGFNRSDCFILIRPQASDTQFTVCDLAQIARNLIEPFNEIARRKPFRKSARGSPPEGRASQNQMPDLVASCFT